MKAKLILDTKTVLRDGRLIQRVVWLVPSTAAGKDGHRFKYRLYCGKNGKTIVRYDNEAGKGDHRHLGANEKEEPYPFTSLAQLLEDFARDVEQLSGEIE